MRPRIASTLLVLLLATAAPVLSAQNKQDKADVPPPDVQDNPLHTATRQELDVVKVLLAQEKAWNAGNLDEFAKGYKNSPDTLFIGHQISKGYAQMLNDYHHNYPTAASMGTLAFSELEVHPLSDTFAVCIGKYHLERSKKEGGAADGLFSLIFEKTDQGWKIVVDHTT
jgi:ketosteroid isomerase-like protein